MPENNNFSHYHALLKQHLSYVEDASFSWQNVVAILIIKLTNTDSLNKDRDVSHATQIQLTSEREETEYRKTEDFFPSLVMNRTFKSWRLKVPARISNKNIGVLRGESTEDLDGWKNDSVQIRRRLLNQSEQGGGNPALQICYGADLLPLRERLQVNDYIVFTKEKGATVYEAFGVKSSVNLGSGKKMFFSDKTENDNTVFELASIDHSSPTDDTPHNKIYFGAPGTGKSHQLNNDSKRYFDDSHCERVTFYPNYSYAQFVGTYKPAMVSNKLSAKNKEIVSILCDKDKTVQEKYDELFGRFRDDNNLTRLPTLLGFYCGNDASILKTKKAAGTPAANDNSVEVKAGIALRDFIQPQLQTNQEITYKYVPGPFIRTYVKAVKNPNENFLLIVEELNRANAAAVFGDLFQLLDRLEDGSSEYPVAASEDLKQYLADEGITDNETISLPSNMYIWTTMNSADQGVFPLDTAFRRRWDYEYLGINTNEEIIKEMKFKVQGKQYSWNKFRQAVNSKLLEFKVNEDKLLGPFYINPKCFSNQEVAAKVIKDKVLMYLYEDAGRQFRNSGLFDGCDIKNGITYSAICDAFAQKGGEIFGVEPDSLNE